MFLRIRSVWPWHGQHVHIIRGRKPQKGEQRTERGSCRPLHSALNGLCTMVNVDLRSRVPSTGTLPDSESKLGLMVWWFRGLADAEKTGVPQKHEQERKRKRSRLCTLYSGAEQAWERTVPVVWPVGILPVVKILGEDVRRLEPNSRQRARDIYGVVSLILDNLQLIGLWCGAIDWEVQSSNCNLHANTHTPLAAGTNPSNFDSTPSIADSREAEPKSKGHWSVHSRFPSWTRFYYSPAPLQRMLPKPVEVSSCFLSHVIIPKL